MTYFLFFIATILAGAMNALAGGGGLITFPLLMLVVTLVTAGATARSRSRIFSLSACAERRSLMLVLEGNVNWNYGVPMANCGLTGGYVGGTISHRANRTVVRFIVITIGFAASAYYFWKLYGPAMMRVIVE